MSSKKKTNKHRTIGHTASVAVTGRTEAEAVLYRFLYKTLPEKSSIAGFQAKAKRWLNLEDQRAFHEYFISSSFGVEESKAFKTYAKLGAFIYIGSKCNRANLLLGALLDNRSELDNFLTLSRSLQVALLEIIISKLGPLEHQQEYSLLTIFTDKLHALGKQLDTLMFVIHLSIDEVAELLKFANKCPEEFASELVFEKLSNFGYSVSKIFSWLYPVSEYSELYTSLLSDAFTTGDEFEAFYTSLVMNMNENAVAWHYTTGEKFLGIAADGVIKPSVMNVVERLHERPITWFTVGQFWEPTTAYFFTGDDPYESRLLTFEETRFYGCGLLRLGLPSSARRDGTLTSWSELWQNAGVALEVKNSLEHTGRFAGSNPNNWYCSFDSVPLQNLIIEYIEQHAATSSWIRMETDEAVKSMIDEIEVRVAEEKERRDCSTSTWNR